MEFKDMDLLDILSRVWTWVSHIDDWSTPGALLARLVVGVLVIYVLLLITKHVVVLIAKLVESWKVIGLPVSVSPEELTHRRRRQQFCKVLYADLAVLAKAENWNDQYFADLEAEVEAEGGYYATPVNRLLKRKSSGLRRVPSLIQAIDTSTEQCILVTGDPGSGKSVALRHLANQIAERASKSRMKDERIPLYLNLKELPAPPPGGPTADFIKDFVLDNIRRGDADTAAYVRENWLHYRDLGLWFFLFDSFDEIPAVLHAPTGSTAIRLHADAIRKFFEGMSSCRGVLASREFKGPDALPWQKFRILPLSAARQEELVQNSFLLPNQKSIALLHVASSRQGILNNPLFLTLLCRYVKEVNGPPTSDNELLLRHIEWLANREPEYLTKRYGLKPEQLLEGSVKLAVLFAEDPALSLAPTIDDIVRSLSPENPMNDLENLLAALIDAKIGRCDVKEAKVGDRRFAFSHRRYQETLFVRHLMQNPDHLSPRALLTDLKWRDYAVTLLQTAPPEVLGPLFEEAGRVLDEYCLSNSPIEVLPAFGSNMHYFEWANSAAGGLLRMLQEGTSRRPEVVPSDLRDKIESAMAPPWNDGDSYDRQQVLLHGALAPEAEYKKWVRWAMESGTVYHWDAAFSNIAFLNTLPEEVAEWFRVQLGDRLFATTQRAEIVRLEAIAHRLPPSVGARWIVARARKTWNLARYVERFSATINGAIQSRVLGQARFSATSSSVPVVLALLSYFVFVLTVSTLLAVYRAIDERNLWAACVAAAVAFMDAVILAQLGRVAFRAVGEKLTAFTIASAMRRKFLSLRGAVAAGGRVTLVPIALLVLVTVIAFWVPQLLDVDLKFPLYFLISSLILFSLLASVLGSLLVAIWRMTRHRLRRLAGLVRSGSPVPRAESWGELSVWLSFRPRECVSTVPECRSSLRLIESAHRDRGGPVDLPLLRSTPALTQVEYGVLVTALLRRMRELSNTAT